jgi:hypothetical protein
MSFSMPIEAKPRRFASLVPKAPERLASSVVSSSSDSKMARSTTDQSTVNGRTEETQSQLLNTLSNSELQSDLEETRRALASLEASLSETYKTAGRLEESVARLKQLVVLQEARIKQNELRGKE